MHVSDVVLLRIDKGRCVGKLMLCVLADGVAYSVVSAWEPVSVFPAGGNLPSSFRVCDRPQLVSTSALECSLVHRYETALFATVLAPCWL